MHAHAHAHACTQSLRGEGKGCHYSTRKAMSVPGVVSWPLASLSSEGVRAVRGSEAGAQKAGRCDLAGVCGNGDPAPLCSFANDGLFSWTHFARVTVQGRDPVTWVGPLSCGPTSAFLNQACESTEMCQVMGRCSSFLLNK